MATKRNKKLKKQVLSFGAVFTEERAGGFSVEVPALPGCVSQGETLEEAVNNIREAIELYLEDNTDQSLIKYHKQKNREFIVPIEVVA